MLHRAFGALILITFLSLAAFPVTPRFWENFTQDELLEGTLTNISLSSDGKLFLAPAYDRIFDTDQPYIFSMVRDKIGNVFVGTGHVGKVFKVDPDGDGSLYFKSDEMDIFAMALDATNTLYVGTSPDGKVYKVTGPNQATEFSSPRDKYIWSLVFDDKGNLYVGTGGRGLIHKVDRSGKSSTFFDADDTHVVSLAMDNDGNLIAGTAPGGLVLRINMQGKPFTLLDSPMEEIRALTLDRFGTIHAVASNSTKSSSAVSSNEGSSTTNSTALPIGTIPALAGPKPEAKESASSVSAPGGQKDSRGSKSSIYAISKDGSTETIYTSKDQMVYDALVRNDGSIVAATGGKGRLISINPAKQVTVITDSPEEQMTRLAAGRDSIWVAGSNQGRVYKLQSDKARTGSFVSKLLDAKVVSSWGKVAWSVLGGDGGAIELATRSGNTETPDGSWSEWSRSYTSSTGQQIVSPKARYLQWKATFKRGNNPKADASTNVLERVRIAYLQQNLRPQVVSIDLLPPGVALQKNPALPTTTVSATSTGANGSRSISPRDRNKRALPPRRVARHGAQSFTWKATDENDDNLEYSIYFKGEGERDWKLLKKKTAGTFFSLDSAFLPDGVYSVKVVASDAPSNPFGKFLIGEIVSKPFVINNSTPRLTITNHRVDHKRVEIQFRSQVQAGKISSAEFSIDGGEWFLVFPTDGIADSLEEEFQLTTPDLGTGEHTIGLRASDTIGNTGTAKLLIRIP